MRHPTRTPARLVARGGGALGRTLCCLALVAGLAACSSPGPDGGAAGTGQTATATPHLDPAAFAVVAAEPGTVLLDVRTPAEFAAGHLPRATNLDVQAADFAARLAGLDKAAHYALYCRSGHRSALAAERMRAAGFDHVVDLSGGIAAWTAAGRGIT